MQGAVVLPPINVGMMEASATRNRQSRARATGCPQRPVRHCPSGKVLRVVDGLGSLADIFAQRVVILLIRARRIVPGIGG